MKRNVLTILSVLIACLFLTSCRYPESSQPKTNDQALTGNRHDKIQKKVQNNYYYSQLGNYQKENYLLLRERSEKFKNTIHLASDSQINLIKTVDAFIMDNPDLYWITAGTYQIESSKLDAYVTFSVPKDAAGTYNELQTLGNSIVNQMPKGNDYQKVAYFYNYIIQHTDYNKEAFKSFSQGNDYLVQQNQDIKSVLIDHLSVCNGYAQTFQFLCQKAGIESVFVRGTAKSIDTNNAVNHAWNLVKINNQYYGVDCTWGDPVFSSQLSGNSQDSLSYQFLCLPDTLLNMSHQASLDIHYQEGKVIKNAWKLPKCQDDSLLYSKLNNYFMDGYNETEILRSIENQLQNGKESIAIQMANSDDYLRLKESLSVNDQTYHDIFSRYWMGYDGFSYIQSPETNTITFMNQ